MKYEAMMLIARPHNMILIEIQDYWCFADAGVSGSGVSALALEGVRPKVGCQ